MATPVVNKEIILNFTWQGPSRWHSERSQDGWNIRSVGLVFKNAKTDVNVHIPENISLSTPLKLPFECTSYDEKEREFNGLKIKVIKERIFPYSLKLTIKQIHDLMIKIGIFENNPYKSPAIMDSSGELAHERPVPRPDREVKLAMLEELEMGQTYTLLLTSYDNYSIEACLIKEKQTDDQIEKAMSFIDLTSESPPDLDEFLEDLDF